MTPLFTLGPLQVTPYSLMMLAGALAGTALTLFLTRARKELRPALPLVILLALVLGHAVWCVFNDGVLESLGGTLPALLQPWLGGYTLYGAIFGALLGACLAARLCRVRLGELLDALAPGAALALFFGRLGEVFTGQGLGEPVENEALQFFPVAWMVEETEDYAEWFFAVWAWEAVIALVILAVLLLRARRSRPGEQAAVFLGALGTSQILMEQLRCDDYVRCFNEFVRFAVDALMAVKEFVFDKPQFDFALRLSLALTALAAALLLILVRGREGKMAAGFQALLGVVLLALHVFGDWNVIDPLLYGVIAYGAAVMGLTLAVNLDGASPAAGGEA